ncbi:MAG: iron ABC transporter permease [Hyphomicrobiaceae bacterium]
MSNSAGDTPPALRWPRPSGALALWRTWRGQRRASPAWTVLVGAILAVMALPVATVIYLALGDRGGNFLHLARTVLQPSLIETATLMLGVGVITLVVGTGTAWIVTMHRFPGRTLIDHLLVLPLAIPTYIVAYAYAEILDYAGPLQSGLRALMGGGEWLPDIRSRGGAIFVLSGVLYPYVYLAARASFVQQSVCVLEVARTLGRTPLGAFLAVGLPLARPALMAGVALVLMECLNDLGAVQYLGVRTLSASIYDTWLQRSSLGGAAQIAAILLLLVAALFAVERLARGNSQYHHTTGRYRAIPFADLTGWRAAAAFAACALPFLIGFAAPFGVIAMNAWHHIELAQEAGFWMAAGNSVLLSATTAMAAVGTALALAYARRVASNGFTRPAVRLAGLGYALPGTVLALGLLIPLAALDNHIDAFTRQAFGSKVGLLVTGTMLVLVVAYTVRFLAVALGGIEAGLERISANLDAAARSLGETAMSALWRIHLPLLMPALGTAGLLVFVDAMKELPATLLLRPFNFETLATHVYAFASLEQLEAASVGSLAIVLVGLVPVVLLHRAIATGRAGH